MKLKKYVLCVMSLAILLVAGGCDPQGEKSDVISSSSSSSSTSTSKMSSSASSASSSGSGEHVAKPAEQKEITVKVYYPNNEGTKLVSVSRKVKLKDGVDKYTAAMQSLMQGTKEAGQNSILPRQVKLRGVKVQEGVAKVDFSGNIVKHFVGGSTGEEMLVASVVNTLTEFPEVTSVQILIDGQPVETLAGHMDLTAPIKRMESLL